jgi:hypothetical protein
VTTCASQLGIEERRLLLTGDLHDLVREAHVAALVTEHPVRPRREAIQEPLGSHEVQVRELGVEEDTLDRSAEADEVEEERPTILGGLETT